MKFSRLIVTVDAHTAGEPIRVIIGGIPRILGDTMSEKKKYFADNFDHIRKLLMFEPRGHKNMCGAVLTEPTRKDCNFGVIFLDSGGYLDMCIHGIIGIVKVLLETGISQKKEKATKICLDTPVGHVTAVASVKNGRVRDIAVFNVPSFLAYSDVKIEVPEVGIINVDIAFGGNFFAIVNASELGIEVQARNMRKLVEIGLTIRDIVNQEIKVIHPRNKYANKVNLVEICGKPKKSKATYRNIVVFGAGQVDRSPCGTGMSAKIATLYTKGLLKVGEQIISESIIGTLFKGKVLSETKVGRFKAVMPEISGSAYITSFNQFVIDPDDPLKAGFLI